MNKPFSFVAIAMSGLIALSGCNKHDHTTANSGSMTAAVVFQTTYTSPPKAISATSCIESSTGNFYVINASWGPYSDITLNIKTNNTTPTKLTTTTYVLDSARVNNTADYMPSAVDYPAKSGSVTITAINSGSITGSFTFTLADESNVSGSFTAISQ